MTVSTTKESNKIERKYLYISVICSVVLWKLISVWVGKPVIIPSPEETLDNLIKIIKNPSFSTIMYYSLRRMFVGFTITISLALILGSISGIYKPVYYLLKPIVTIFKSIPTMAVILLAIIWLESEKAPMLVGALVCFPIMYQNVVEGIENADKKLIEMTKLYKISKFKIMKEVYLPSMKTYLLAALSTTSGLNIKIVIAAEVLCQPQISIGTNFQIERSNLNTGGVFAWSIIAIVIASSFDIILKYIKQRSKLGY